MQPGNENAERKSEAPSNFPSYPQGIVVADPKYHSPLYKLMRSMMGNRKAAKPSKARVGGKKGLSAPQSVHITRRKSKNY